MKHRVDRRKLGRTSSHRQAMLNNMATSLFKHERIQTTVPKAKELQRYAEKLITRAKNDSTHSRRIVFKSIREKKIIEKLFDEIAPRFANRNGGYTRILKLDYRMADAAPTAIIELVGSEDVKKKDQKAAKKPAKAKEVKEKDVKPAKKAEAKKQAEEVSGTEDVHDHSVEPDAVFKTGKAKDDAREAFMDKTVEAEAKADQKKKIFDRWRKKELEETEEEAKPKQKTAEKKEEKPVETKAEKEEVPKEEKAEKKTEDTKKADTEEPKKDS